MTVRKRDSAGSSPPRYTPLKDRLAKIDAHVITPDEYREIPDCSDEPVSQLRIRPGATPTDRRKEFRNKKISD